MAQAIGLDGGEVSQVLQGERYGNVVDDSTRRAQSLGVSGIPAWLLDSRLLVLGAQPREVFERAFEQLRA